MGVAGDGDGTCGELSVDRIGLATTAMAALWTLDLEYLDALRAEVAGETGTVGAGALDASTEETAEGGRPGEELAVAGGTSGKRRATQDGTHRIEDGCGVRVEVGVHAEKDVGG
jgi:hypothetical protein